MKYIKLEYILNNETFPYTEGATIRVRIYVVPILKIVLIPEPIKILKICANILLDVNIGY